VISQSAAVNVGIASRPTDGECTRIAACCTRNSHLIATALTKRGRGPTMGTIVASFARVTRHGPA
jgi:hypothetical protein